MRMKLSTKAALYSAIVFPGAGYFIVKNKLRGGIALSISLGCLVVFMIEAFNKAQIIAGKIVSGEIPYDINIIRDQIPLTPGVFATEFIMVTTICIALVWIVGGIDSYRLGKLLDKL